MKKTIIIMLALLALCTPVFAGGQSETTAAKTTASSTPTLNPDGSFHLPIVDSPKEFTIFLNFNNMPFDSNWKVWKKLAADTNVSFKSVISQSNSNETEAYNLMLSSGNLADVIGYVSTADLESLGRDGGLIALNDLIDEYAPNIKKMMEDDPKFAQYATSTDGNIYFIPKNQGLKAAEYWWIRNDWLQKLGLEVPTNVDEFEKVMYAFRNNDPNGNGVKDEIPLFDRAGWKMPEEYLYLFDSSTGFYTRNGVVEFEPLEENFRYGVRKLIQWYKDGILDPEIFTRGNKSRDVLLAANIGGCTHDWVSTSEYNVKLANEIPGLEMIAIAPPADQNGVVKERTERFPGVGWGISSACKDPVTVIKFFDYLFSEAGSALMNWGIEGEEYYVDENGNKKFYDSVLHGSQSVVGYLRSIGALYRVGFHQDGGYELASMNKWGFAASELYEGHPEWFLSDQPPYSDGELDMKYQPDDEARYKRIMNNIKPYVEEKFQSWIIGTADFEADYDKFISELHSRGIDEAIAINQKAYDYYMSAGK